MRGRIVILVLPLLLALLASQAQLSWAQSRPQADFGPTIVIENIRVDGNSSTEAEVIEEALPLSRGDHLAAGGEILEIAKYRVLALGYFRRVHLHLEKGSERGKVVLVVEVEERGTVVLNQLFFGTSLISPWWGGIDIGERNFLGTGLLVSGAFVAAGKGRVDGASLQKSATLRIGDSALFGSRFGWQASVFGIDASEPYRVRGQPDDAAASNFAAFSYSRLGGRGVLSTRLTRLSRVDFGGRFEAVDTDLPANPTRELPSGESRSVELDLEDGRSYVTSGFVSYDRDTRADPVLPWGGDRLLVHTEAGVGAFVGDYSFATALAKYERWWPVKGREHVISAHISGGAVIGDAPRFERIHVGDINRMVAPRALGLVLSSTPSLDLLGTSTDEIVYGDVGGIAEVQYSYRLFSSTKLVYGGQLFFGLGVWALGSTASDLDPRSSPPVDLLVDAGLRLDTEIGIFELTLANALGRLPL